MTEQVSWDARTVDRMRGYIFRQLPDDEARGRALALAWWESLRWRGAQDWRWIASAGVHRARAGRDLPGVRGRPNYVDAFDRPVRHGAGMDQVRDRRPGPAQLASNREAVAIIRAGIRGRMAQLVELLLSGASVHSAAREMGVGQSTARRYLERIRARFILLDPNGPAPQ